MVNVGEAQRFEMNTLNNGIDYTNNQQHVAHLWRTGSQSETLNLTTVFRVSAFAVINRAFFFIWLPIIGFSPALSTSVIIFIGLFQFLTHTRLVGKVGILEYIFVTPSSHRVHHGRDPKYIDKNYTTRESK